MIYLQSFVSEMCTFYLKWWKAAKMYSKDKIWKNKFYMSWAIYELDRNHFWCEEIFYWILKLFINLTSVCGREYLFNWIVASWQCKIFWKIIFTHFLGMNIWLQCCRCPLLCWDRTLEWWVITNSWWPGRRQFLIFHDIFRNNSVPVESRTVTNY